MRIPVQRSLSEASCWRVRRHDLTELPTDAVLAGTMQRSCAHHVEDLLASVPRIDALHLFNWHVGRKSDLLGFLRTTGEVAVARLKALLLDDWPSTTDPDVLF